MRQHPARSDWLCVGHTNKRKFARRTTHQLRHISLDLDDPRHFPPLPPSEQRLLVVLDILQIRKDLQQGHPNYPIPLHTPSQRYRPDIQLRELTRVRRQLRGRYMFIRHVERPVNETDRVEVDLEVSELCAIGCENRKAVHRHVYRGRHTGDTPEVEFGEIRHGGGDC